MFGYFEYVQIGMNKKVTDFEKAPTLWYSLCNGYRNVGISESRSERKAGAAFSSTRHILNTRRGGNVCGVISLSASWWRFQRF